MGEHKRDKINFADMRESLIFGGSTRNHSENLFKDKVGQRLESSQLSLFAGRVDSDPTISLFLVMSTHKRIGSPTKFSNGATASASRNEDPIHKIIREYFDYSPGFASIPASVIARYLGAMLTEYVGSTENRDEITMCDMAYHATRTISFIIALQEAFGKEEGHG